MQLQVFRGGGAPKSHLAPASRCSALLTSNRFTHAPTHTHILIHHIIYPNTETGPFTYKVIRKILTSVHCPILCMDVRRPEEQLIEELTVFPQIVTEFSGRI